MSLHVTWTDIALRLLLAILAGGLIGVNRSEQGRPVGLRTTLLVCLAPKIAVAEVEPLALGIADWHKHLAPAGETRVIFRDSAFADDVAKTNLTAILQQHGLAKVNSL